MRVLQLAVPVLCLTLASPWVRAAEAVAPTEAEAPTELAGATERLRITDPYIELHTGPGRGYPVFHVASRHEWVEIELRRTDWFRVRTAGGQVGWVTRAQLSSTLTASGATKGFRDVLIDDFLARRVQMGAAWGRFSKDPMLKVWGSYRLADTLSLEATLGQVQGLFTGTDFWHLDVVTEPWSDQRFSPFAAIGVGRFKNVPNNSLVGATITRAKLGHAMVGLNVHLSDRFLLRTDYALNTVYLSDTRTTEYRAWTLGVAFFF